MRTEGASKQKLLLGVGLLGKILFVEAHPNLRSAGSTPQNGDVCNDNRVGPANKSCFSGWVCLVNFYLWGALSNLGHAGSTPPKGGISLNNWVWDSKQKLFLGVGLHNKTLFWGAHLTPGPAGSTYLMGVLA